MKCFECGTTMKISYEDYPYASLPGVTLKNIEVRRCPACNEQEVVIPKIEELNRVLARIVARYPGRLRSTEIRFLRKYLGWSQRDLARKMDLAPETISRWETDDRIISPVYDQLLRSYVLLGSPIEDYGAEQLSQ